MELFITPLLHPVLFLLWCFAAILAVNYTKESMGFARWRGTALAHRSHGTRVHSQQQQEQARAQPQCYSRHLSPSQTSTIAKRKAAHAVFMNSSCVLPKGVLPACLLRLPPPMACAAISRDHHPPAPFIAFCQFLSIRTTGSARARLGPRRRRRRDRRRRGRCRSSSDPARARERLAAAL